MAKKNVEGHSERSEESGDETHRQAQGDTKVKVKLLKDHTHAGKDYKTGEVIEVREDQVKWLEEAGVIETKQETTTP